LGFSLSWEVVLSAARVDDDDEHVVAL